MDNIIQFKNNVQITNFSISKLYDDLISSGFSNCSAYNEVIKLLLIKNPTLDLSDLSKKKFEIINPLYENYFENGIDNHSHN